MGLVLMQADTGLERSTPRRMARRTSPSVIVPHSRPASSTTSTYWGGVMAFNRRMASTIGM
ncbi:MAG: hypothetical protein AUH74_00170 [Nitrospirae bacterium 13_1_40CM_4_62_6]|nr:MAG: hypothetical protein AUH74_00170 [Nitrospirae bacterium 13_1_40CM_4_62_6]